MSSPLTPSAMPANIAVSVFGKRNLSTMLVQAGRSDSPPSQRAEDLVDGYGYGTQPKAQ